MLLTSCPVWKAQCCGVFRKRQDPYCHCSRHPTLSTLSNLAHASQTLLINAHLVMAALIMQLLLVVLFSPLSLWRLFFFLLVQV
eukprot:533772-Pelagomonas_calceolata.AAC.2